MLRARLCILGGTFVLLLTSAIPSWHNILPALTGSIVMTVKFGRCYPPSETPSMWEV